MSYCKMKPKTSEHSWIHVQVVQLGLLRASARDVIYDFREKERVGD